MLINFFLVTGVICCSILLIFCGTCDFVSNKDYFIYGLLIICIAMYFGFLFFFNRGDI